MSLVGRSATVAFEVTAPRGDVEEFAASLGASITGRLPTTYPIRWLTDRRIAATVRDLAADRPQSLPVHELQTVESLAPLPVGTPLALTAAARRTDEIHVALDAEVRHGETPVCRLHAVLRLVP